MPQKKPKSGRKSRIITCPYCRRRFSLHSKKKTPLQKTLDKIKARERRTSKKLSKDLVDSIFRN